MADNVPFQSTTVASPAAGTTISTEEVTTLNTVSVTAQQMQRVVPAFRTADATAVDFPGDAANGLDVDVTRSALPTGAATSANQASELTLVGAVTEPAPASDTASSGLNGRLQRIAQRITSLIALLPSALGANGGLKIEGVASGTVVPVSGTITAVAGVASTGTLSNVASSATNVTLVASNASRKMATIYNDSTQVLYVKLGATASATSYTLQMAAGTFFELPSPVYTGIIDGLWASANGNARVTEIT